MTRTRTTPKARLLLLVGLVTALAVGVLPVSAHNEGLPSVPLARSNVEHVANLPNLVGNNIDWLERVDEDGTVRRYLIAANVGNGFDVVDITEPAHPVTVGRYLLPDNNPAALQQSSLGANVHAWVSVNPRRDIVALTVEEPGRTLRHNGGGGIQFVDISDLTNPRSLGKVDGLDGPHTVRMIGDTHAYTSLSTWLVDYTDPMNPTAEKGNVEGHEFWEDPNVPGTMWVGIATAIGRFGRFDVTDPANPRPMGPATAMLDVRAAHEVYPAPDNSYVGIADFTTGQLDTECPGGGVHFYDISGRYVPGASPSNPIDLGEWFAPYSGLTGRGGAPNSASCTMHSWHHHPERSLALVGLYTGGTWVFDPSVPTPEGTTTEYSGTRGRTTWGRTLGNIRDAADFVNAAQFLPFDLTEAGEERYFITSGFERGVDVYRYTGPMPKKLSDLEAQVGPGGVVSGTLQRFAVLGPEGYEQIPLGGRELVVVVDGVSRTVTTAGDGSFSLAADAAGATSVTVTLPGDDVFATNTVVLR